MDEELYDIIENLQSEKAWLRIFPTIAATDALSKPDMALLATTWKIVMDLVNEEDADKPISKVDIYAKLYGYFIAILEKVFEAKVTLLHKDDIH